MNRLNLLAAILNHARAEWDVPLRENPASADAVKRPEGADKKRDRRLVPAPREAVRKALDQGEEPPKGEEERLLAQVAKSVCKWDLPLTRWSIASAWRQGESLELRWRDVVLDAKVATVRGRHGIGTKNKEHREEKGHEKRPLPPEALAVLRELWGDGKHHGDDLVFDVGPPHAFRVRFGRQVERAGLRDLTFHDLRHEATSRLAKRYPNALDLKPVTGHRDLKSLDRYYQPDLTELAEREAA